MDRPAGHTVPDLVEGKIRKISNTQSKHGLDRASQVKQNRNKTTNNENKNKRILTMEDN